MKLAPLKSGSYIGPFLLKDKLALGGMAEIWVATEDMDYGRERTVGLKVLQPTFGQDHEFRAMFWDEVNIARHLRHENILRVYDGHEIDGYLLQSMELLDGMDVRRLLLALSKAGEWFPAPLALYVGRELARALGYAHNRRTAKGHPMEIVHRDVSPHNVMITREGTVKILDFGIARAAERHARTRTGVIKGKLSYMAPEQALATDVSPQTDIFAAGIVLWEILAMQRLFRGNSETETLNMVVEARAPYLLEKNSVVPKEAAELIHQMLAASPKNRPTSMQEIEHRLDRILMKRYAPDAATAEAMSSWLHRYVGAPPTAPRPRTEVRPPNPPEDVTAQTEPHTLTVEPPSLETSRERPNAIRGSNPWDEDTELT